MVAGVLINTDPAKTKEVYEQLKSLEGVANITAVFGRFDWMQVQSSLPRSEKSKVLQLPKR
jgi:hypothetical protein